MRRTISIDDELHARVERFARKRGRSFSAALSELVRVGLGDREAGPYRLRPHDGGRALVHDLDDLPAVMDVLDEHDGVAR